MTESKSMEKDPALEAAIRTLNAAANAPATLSSPALPVELKDKAHHIPIKQLTLVDPAAYYLARSQRCCAHECLARGMNTQSKDPGDGWLTLNVWLNHRSDYAKRSESGRSQFLADYCRQNALDPRYVCYQIDHHPVCREAWREITGCSSNKLQKAHDDSRSDPRLPLPPREHKDRTVANKHDMAKAWLENFVSSAECDRTETRCVLPPLMDFGELYKKFLKQHGFQPEDFPQSNFDAARLEFHPRIEQAKETDFAYCDECGQYLKPLAALSPDDPSRDPLAARLKLHKDQADNERALLERNAEAARTLHDRIHMYDDSAKPARLVHAKHKPVV